MFNTLLATSEKTREIPILESAFYALLGFVIVFIGIAFLILVVWLIGKGMSKTGKKSLKKTLVKEEIKEIVPQVVASTLEDEVSEELVAVITAALTAYYQANDPKCAFTVKRIKRI